MHGTAKLCMQTAELAPSLLPRPDGSASETPSICIPSHYRSSAEPLSDFAGALGGRGTILAAIMDKGSIVKVLTHLGLDSEPPRIAPARAPPGGELLWE